MQSSLLCAEWLFHTDVISLQKITCITYTFILKDYRNRLFKRSHLITSALTDRVHDKPFSCWSLLFKECFVSWCWLHVPMLTIRTLMFMDLYNSIKKKLDDLCGCRHRLQMDHFQQARNEQVSQLQMLFSLLLPVHPSSVMLLIKFL